jgi:hypothetical protein
MGNHKSYDSTLFPGGLTPLFVSSLIAELPLSVLKTVEGETPLLRHSSSVVIFIMLPPFSVLTIAQFLKFARYYRLYNKVGGKKHLVVWKRRAVFYLKPEVFS